MSRDETPSPAELDTAISRVAAQIERLEEGPTIGFPSDDRGLIAELQEELQALRQLRVNAG